MEFIETTRNILRGHDPRLLLIVGPCSIDDASSAIVYMRLLAQLQEVVKDQFFCIMRLFTEKSRSGNGWPGFLYEKGLLETQRLQEKAAEIGVPIAREFVDPLFAPYLEKNVTLGIIGARSHSSYPHRLLAARLPCPVGIKHGLDGDLELARGSLAVARSPQTCYKVSDHGIVQEKTPGNPDAFLILRGTNQGPNAAASLEIDEPHAIDSAHGNSDKRIELQEKMFRYWSRQNHPSLRALMLESYLYEGRSDAREYGISITDPCLSWERTEMLVQEAAQERRSLLSKIGAPILRDALLSH